MAVDNTARLCGRCSQEQSDQLRTAPTQLPGGFFDSAEFRAAFDSQHIGKVCKAYRNHPRHLHLFGKALSQELLGRWLGLTQAQVSRLENGKPELNLETLRHYAKALHLPQHMLWFDFPGQTRLRPPRDPAVAPPPTSGGGGILAATAGMAVGMAVVPDRIGVDDITTVRDSMAQLVALDNRFGGADLTRLATRLYTDLHHRVGAGSYDPAIRADLMATVGELAEIAGWIAYDADQHDLVRKLNLEALHFTRLAGDTSVELLTLQNASMHAGQLGMPNEALAIADSVLDGPYRLTPRLRALFLIRKARALAQGGDGAALGLIGQARSLYDDGVDNADPAWAWWIDERELSWHEAMCRQELGDRRGARDWFERSVEATAGDETRSQYLHRAYLLHAQVGSGSWSAAVATMRELAPLAVQVASNRTMRLILDALHDLDRAGTSPPDVRDAGRQLRSLLTGPTP